MHTIFSKRLLVLIAAILIVAPVFAAVTPHDSPVRDKEYRNSELNIRNSYLKGDLVAARGGASLVGGLESLGVAPQHAYLDVRTGRWGTLMPAEPLLPGGGVGNNLSWNALYGGEPADLASYKGLAWEAFVGYLQQHEAALNFDISELTSGRLGVYDGGIVQIHANRHIRGVQVRDSHLTAVINKGNLILLGSVNWHDVNVSTEPTIDVEAAWESMRTHLGDQAFGLHGTWGKTDLVLVPTSRGDLDTLQIGDGLGYRLAWVLRPDFLRNHGGSYEALVDAHSGEFLLWEDTHHYGAASARTVVGGVLPETNDGLDANGIEQPGWPMPFLFVNTPGGTLTTDTGGNVLACIDGEISTSLSGPYLIMNDNCGAINESTTGSLLDLGINAGDDCSIPAGASAGNTKSSRSGFYEMGRIIEQAQAQLPGNTWLQTQLTSNMNINSSCNAFWSGTVNFYRSGGGCGNTGEIAGVFDHEWGHGMDDNDVEGSVTQPGEGIADIYAALRLETSCIGRGFFDTGTCSGYGDPCTECTGIRDIDWAKRTSGVPHDIDFIDGACGSGSGMPCGGSTHCEGSVYAEAVWDLYHRDLPSLYGMDINTGREIATRLTFLGAGLVDNWFQCTTPFGGCNADGGYLNYLAVDDDNGNLTDGTPHMQAIFDAFDRHQIACGSPTVADTGCAGTPTEMPVVTATGIDRGVTLEWGAVSGASSYNIYRGEGINEADTLGGGAPVLNEGRALVGTVDAEGANVTFTDTGLLNGRDYFYNVIPMGPGPSCFGPASATVLAVPAAGVNLALDELSVEMAISGGDGDEFLDNCETGTFSFDLTNIGIGAATNVTVTSVRSTTHSAVDATINVLSSPIASLASCDLGSASFDFIAQDLAPNDIIGFEVCFTSDEITPRDICGNVSFSATEGDFGLPGNRTFSYNADLDTWTVTEGTFAYDNGPAQGGNPGFIDSSSFLNDQCDVIASPLMRIGDTSTLSMWTSYDIEAFDTQWWDRANIGVVDSSGSRTTLVPTGGRAYEASGPGGVCGLDTEPGWAGTQADWASSSFNNTVLSPFAGQLVQLEVRYGTDVAVVGDGFSFDQVRITDIQLRQDDPQTDACEIIIPFFADGFESGDTSAWSNTVPLLP